MIVNREHFDIGGKVILEKVAFRPPFKISTDMVNEACFLHIIKGTSKLFLPERHIDLNDSDSLFLKCSTYMNAWQEKKEDQVNEALLVHIYPEILDKIFDQQLPSFLKGKEGVKHSSAEKIKISIMIENYIESLLFYFNQPSIVTEELVEIKVKELLLLLVNSHYSDNLEGIFSNLFTPNEYKFKELIDTHLFEDLSIQDYADIAGMSLSTFKRRFQMIYKISPKKYINNRRLEKAKQLLLNTEDRISDIAYDCGFNDVGYFSKTFNSHFNCSPSFYRKTEVQAAFN
ncbi:helix-turn-helix domain-containing protein [Flammeovirga sp. SubArs3]|uniref:AraC family transcriptional regulator n=1 Tax=Flammeovirga sp. SubArs3 TaxID=2995316 RepID=UPI00248C4792|nr:helix-turn-helix domain-containing protein [Flammeovirga sp. SubArs3]